MIPQRRHVLEAIRSSISRTWERGGGNELAPAVSEGQSVPHVLSQPEIDVLETDLREVDAALAEGAAPIPHDRLVELARTYTTVTPVDVIVADDPRSPYAGEIVDDLDAFELGTSIGKSSPWVVNTLDGRRVASHR